MKIPFLDWRRKDKSKTLAQLPVRIIGASVYGKKREHVGFAVSEFGHEVSLKVS